MGRKSQQPWRHEAQPENEIGNFLPNTFHVYRVPFSLMPCGIAASSVLAVSVKSK
jgi:hypothetical protein